MALIGGTQGNQVLSLTQIQAYAQAAVDIAQQTTGNFSAETNRTMDALKLPIGPLPIAYLSPPTVNFRDNISKGDKSHTPLQFTSKLADCRMFYMAADILHVNNTWARVARGVAKNGEGLCVSGSVSS